MFGNQSNQTFGSQLNQTKMDGSSGNEKMETDNTKSRSVFGTATTTVAANIGFVFGMSSSSTASQQPIFDNTSTKSITPVFGGSSTMSKVSFNQPLFGKVHQSVFPKPSETSSFSTPVFTTAESDTKKNIFVLSHTDVKNKNEQSQEGTNKSTQFQFGKENLSSSRRMAYTTPLDANESSFQFSNTPLRFDSPQLTNVASSENPFLTKQQSLQFGGIGNNQDQNKSTTPSTVPNLFSSITTPSMPFVFGKPYGNVSAPQNLFGTKTAVVSSPTSFKQQTTTLASHMSHQDVFKKPLERVSPKYQQFSFKSSHSSNVFSKLGTTPSTKEEKQLTVKTSESDHKKIFKKTNENKETKHEGHVASKRQIIQRPTITGNLFGQALAGIKRSSKDMVRRRRVSEEETEARSRGHEVRLIRTEELSRVKSIVCKGIPVSLNENLILRNMFSVFGNVKRVFCNPMKQLAIIHFLTHDDAARAKQNGAKLFPNSENVAIFWSQSLPTVKKKSPESKATVEASKSLLPKLLHEQPKYKFKDDEVEEELRSMSAGTDDFTSQNFLERPSDLVEKQTKRPLSSSDKTTVRSKKKKDPEVDSLLSTLHKQALTAGDKFLVLDARDKLLRQNKKKQSTLDTAEIYVGTCQDMCPEKERYLREDKGQLHPYEIEYQTTKMGEEPHVNHKTVVKEYSRSSADQEEPLPHDLRPASVLKMTMDHLICNIIDRLDHSDNPAEWYDFVWNRTRSIRKDITQQHLCNTVSVELVEKCARFHIHCAERLCEEDMRNFDQKINNENLTKCLQTLKHFYHDLGLKNISCTNEPEFRGYDVLLNLNEGNILWQVQQLKSDIQSSDEVRFALQAFAALNSNNYIRFFKLVEKASYLNACIMHRYFIQVRSKALQTLTRACCPGTHTTLYPLKEIKKLLGFQDEKEIEEFCTVHSLSVRGENIVLDRVNITQPEISLSLRRSKNLIENKRTVLVGEVVNGGPLPLDPSLSYEPCNSFTQDGYLTNDILKALTDDKTETDKQTKLPPSKIEASSSDDVTSKKPVITKAQLKDVIKDLTKDVILEELHDNIHGICKEFLEKASYIMQGAQEMASICLQETSDSLTKEIVSETVDEAKQEEMKERQKRLAMEQQQELAKQEEEMKAWIVNSIYEEVYSEVISSEMRTTAAEEIRNMEALKMQAMISECTPVIAKEILSQVIVEECSLIADNVFTEDVIKIKRKLSIIKERLWMLRISYYFHHWKKSVAALQRTRKNAQEFPSIPGAKFNMTQNTTKFNDLNEFSLPMDRLSQQLNMCYLFDAAFQYQLINDRIKSLPLDMKQAAKSMLDKEAQPTVYWKILISLPELSPSREEDKSLSSTIKWLQQKISHNLQHQNIDCEKKVQLWSLYSVDVDKNIHSQRRKFSLCIKAVRGWIENAEIVAVEKNRDFLGSHGILFVLPSLHDNDDKQMFWRKHFFRLEQMLKLNNYTPALPIVVLLCGWSTDEFNNENGPQHLNLEDFVTHKMTSNYFIQSLPKDVTPESSLQLMESLKVLAKNKPPLPELMSQPLSDFIEDVFMQWFSIIAFQNLAERNQQNLTDQDPYVLIVLYNSAIEYAIHITTSHSLRRISWPIAEFANSNRHPDLPSLEWNSDLHFNCLRKTLMMLKLPLFNEFASDDWETVSNEIKTYISSLSLKEGMKTHLRTKVNKLLKRNHHYFKRRCRLKYGVADCSPTIHNVPWTDIIHMIAESVISALNHSLDSPCIKQPQCVYYLIKEFNEYVLPETWRKASRTYDSTASSLTIESLERTAVKRKQDTNDSETECKRQVIMDLPATENLRTDDYGLEVLLRKIQSEKEKSQKFDERLLKCLHEPDSSSLDVEDSWSINVSCTDDTSNLTSFNTSHSLTLHDQLVQLQASIESQKLQDKLFEKRLKFICDFGT